MRLFYHIGSGRQKIGPAEGGSRLLLQSAAGGMIYWDKKKGNKIKGLCNAITDKTKTGNPKEGIGYENRILRNKGL